MLDNPWFTDTHLLKFCRARQFDLDKVFIMWEDYMAYREANNINTVMSTYEWVKRPELHPFYPNGYCGVDKKGRPVYIERSGMIDVDKVWETIPEDDLLEAFRHSYESL